ncbi:MAG: AarF/ABC1/UbiB kinase family protein [Desulfobacteraceae bacterium]|nr:AarF/ABC1/UbiB kinase family protein [Desulfobacteraceae bacterium]
MGFASGVNHMRGFRRLGTIARVLVRHGFGVVADRLSARPVSRRKTDGPTASGSPAPRRIRRVLEELGPSFIKLGQLMSTRADVFPPEYIDEFKKLQDQVPPLAFAEIKALIEAELGQPLAVLFADFPAESIAAASVAQVYAARLADGTPVAVKVVRPGIAKKIREDIRLMYTLAARLEKNFALGRVLGAVNIVQEFERTIFNELDMLREAGNIEKFAANFKSVEDICVPEIYWELTTPSVLVMSFVEGVKVDEVAAIRAAGIDPREIALIGLRSLSRQLMEFGFFHADPHPGNTIVMPDGRVGLVDFGIMGYLDEETMHQVAHVFLGYAERDYDLVMEALLASGVLPSEGVDLARFRRDLKDISEPFYGRSLQTISVRDVYDQVMQLVSKYQIHLPRNLLLLFKTLIQTEALGKTLNSDASILTVMKPYARQLLQKGYESRKILRNMGQELRNSGNYLKTAPKLIHDILKQTATGKQVVALRHTGFNQLNQKFERSVNRLVIGLIVSASTIAAALILNSDQTVIQFQVRLLGYQSLSLTAVLGVVGYCIATVLGLWLIISIFRSGKL